MQKTIAIICVFTGLTTTAFASANKISTYYETGTRSATDTLEDRDISANFDFYKYFMRVDQEASKALKYNASYLRSHRDYDTLDNFDFVTDQWRLGLDYVCKPDVLKLSFDASFTDKDYKRSPTLSYNRSSASMGLHYIYKEAAVFDWDNGFTSYSYDRADTDQFKVYTRIGGAFKFFDERFKINPTFKYQKVNNESAKDRIEQVTTLSSYLKLDMKHFNKISGYFAAGRNDTKDYEDEERDDDFIFNYFKWHAVTEHPLTEKLDTSFKYGQFRRDYQNSNNDYKVWYLDNKMGFKIYDDKMKKISVSTQLEHKEGTYHLVDTLNYVRQQAVARLSYNMKNNWELAPSFAFKRYDYSASPTSDLKQYDLKVEFQKELESLLKKDLSLNLTYKYIWKDYMNKADITQWSVKAGLEYKF